MSVRNLEFLLRPESVAVVGASRRPHSVGNAVLRNMLAGGFDGPVLPVNPRYDDVEGVRCHADVRQLPHSVDLAVVCTPPDTVPDIIEQLGGRGTRGIVILTAGLGSAEPGHGHSLAARCLAAAGAHGVRLLGPNCLGLMAPPIGLNASFAPGMVRPGSLAFVSQSGALATAVADWSHGRGIGFSCFVSLGNALDVDFADLLDYLGGDPQTSAILLYIESVRNARKFLSAGRAAARNKPVVVVKAGRNEDAARAAASHTGALAGSDRVYDAAFRRAGMLRVFSTEDLFDAVETLARGRRPHGSRLVIVTNGGGPGVMAVDALPESVRLAELGAGTLERLNSVLPPTWSGGNPVDLIGDAPPERYRQALEILIDSGDADAVAFLHAPTAIVPADAIAAAVAPLLQPSRLPVYTCWMGGQAVEAARDRFEAAGLPLFDSPEDTVRAFGRLTEFRANQAELRQIPPTGHAPVAVDRAAARQVIDAALKEKRDLLTEPEAKAVLAAYGIPVVVTRVAGDADAAVAAATEIGYPVAVKVLSPDISHKSDVGGVVLGIDGDDALREAVAEMRERVSGLRPEARIEGYTVQQMIRRPEAYELIVGASTDAVFGPVILFGQGGTAVEVIADRAVGLPPLNQPLAEGLIARTRVARLLAGYRDRPAADREALGGVLMAVSQLMIDLPEIGELDINPLLADSQGIIALDARIALTEPVVPGTDRLAILPYPSELEESHEFDGGHITVRPIKPEDEPAHGAFLDALESDDIRFRFFGLVRHFPHEQLARYTQIDYDREMAFIATRDEAEGPRTLGVVRSVIRPGLDCAEFAIVIRSDLKGRGLGHLLLDRIIRYCRQRGLERLVGQTLAENTNMLMLARSLGFTCTPTDDHTVDLELRLD